MPNTYKLPKTFLEQLYYILVLPKKSTEGKVFKSKKTIKIKAATIW